MSGKNVVCMAKSGPGATNLITGIANAYMDSVPLIATTGQVATSMIGRDAFQEVDITGATAPFCKHNYLIKDANDIAQTLKDAFYIASTGRPGPVVIDIPIDVSTSVIDYKPPHKTDIRGYKPNVKGHPLQIRKICSAIANQKTADNSGRRRQGVGGRAAFGRIFTEVSNTCGNNAYGY